MASTSTWCGAYLRHPFLSQKSHANTNNVKQNKLASQKIILDVLIRFIYLHGYIDMAQFVTRYGDINTVETINAGCFRKRNYNERSLTQFSNDKPSITSLGISSNSSNQSLRISSGDY